MPRVLYQPIAHSGATLWSFFAAGRKSDVDLLATYGGVGCISYATHVAILVGWKRKGAAEFRRRQDHNVPFEEVAGVLPTGA